MKLIIMRHGEAGWAAASDFERVLTARGQQEVLNTASKLAEKETVDKVLASPYLRAQQTADIVAETLGCSVGTLDALIPEGSPGKVVEQLPESGTVLLASHMPLVSVLAGLLCDGVTSRGPGFNTAHALVLEMEFPAPGLATEVRWIAPG